MKTEPCEAEKQDGVAVRGASGALGLLLSVVAIMQIYGSPFSMDGWTSLAGALVFGSYAFTYKRSQETVYRASKGRLAGILAICVVPPVVLLCLFGDRPGWSQPLVVYLLLSLSLGPVLLLRRYVIRPKGEAPPPNSPAS